MREKKQKGTGGLLSITVNPYTCKGCMLCVKVCNDDALRPVDADSGNDREAAQGLGILASPAHDAARIHPHRKPGRKIGALETLLLDKNNYLGMVGGDGACLGCGEKTVVHLFTAPSKR